MEYINLYFENLGKLNFNSAKNNIKLMLTEENISLLFHLLNQIVNLEKNYYNLIFVTRKLSGFLGRKKQIKSYLDAQIQLNEIRNGKKCVSMKCELLLSYLLFLVDHRCNMIEFYRSVANLKAKSGFRVSDSLAKLVAVKDLLQQGRSRNGDSGRLFDALLITINLEVSILSRLLEAHDETTNLHFLEPLNGMHAADADLSELELVCGQSEARDSRAALPLLAWLRELSRFVLDKYTLYFLPVLSRHSQLALGDSVSPDAFPLVERIRQFAARQAPCTATLLFDTTQQARPYAGQGYALPFTRAEPLIGMQNYQQIFSTATTPLNQDELYLTVSLVREKIDNEQRKIAHLVQNGPNLQSISYFVCKIEFGIYFSLIFGSSKNEKDRQTLSFINDICTELQGLRIIELLRFE